MLDVQGVVWSCIVLVKLQRFFLPEVSSFLTKHTSQDLLVESDMFDLLKGMSEMLNAQCVVSWCIVLVIFL